MGRMRIAGVVGALALAVVIATVLPRAGADESPPPAMRVLFTSDTRGNLEPCGCEKGQFGGIARRATALGKLRRPGDLLLDLGNLGGGPGELHRLGWVALLDALREMKYDALVPGGTDLSEIDALLHAAAAGGPAVVCANLVRSADGSPVFPRWLVVGAPGGKRYAVVGLTSDSQPVTGSYRTLPLVTAAKEAVAELQGKADGIILAGWIEGQPAFDLAQAFPTSSMVLAGHVPKGGDDLTRRGGAPVMAGGERGQYVAEIDLDATCAATRAARIWLGEDIPDDSAMRTRITAWKEELRKHGDDAVAATLEAFRNAGRIGSRGCAECHADEHRGWLGTKHAHAMDSLRAKQEDRNPLCVRCHMQDVRGQGGVLTADQDGGVGCEACHGPGARHATARQRQDVPTPMNAMGKIDEASCRRCHDEENSRSFAYASYWERVRHGKTGTLPDKR